MAAPHTDRLSGRIDLHMHTTVSDGTDTPEELIDTVTAAGITLFSVTDHDAILAAEILPPLLAGKNLCFLPGVEFSCRDEAGKYHILGYGFDPGHAAIREVVGHGHALRMKKVLARLDFLRTRFGFDFPEEEIERLLARENPGKPHIGNLMVKCGFAKTKEEAIDNYIDQVHLPNEYIRPEEAIGGILASGGVPVLAHPYYGSGNELILGDEMEERLHRLMGFGLQGVEAFYSGFSHRLCAGMLDLARRYDLYVTAGSDYHGTNKLVRPGDTGLEPGAGLPDGMLRFLRRFGLAPEEKGDAV